MSGSEQEIVASVADIPLCHGCGLASHYVHPETPICPECFRRAQSRAGGGLLRVVTPAGTYHETPLCPAVRTASEWRYWRDESCMHADLGGDMDKCARCHSFRTFGFDHYDADSAVVGHA